MKRDAWGDFCHSWYRLGVFMAACAFWTIEEDFEGQLLFYTGVSK